MSYVKRGALLLLVVLVVAGLVACGDSDDETSANTTISIGTGGEKAPAKDEGGSALTTIVVRDGEPVGGVQELGYDAGDQIRFRVRSNVADEVHVHGYDVSKEVSAGGAATLSFPADLEGIYEVELHGSERQIAELRVNP
jgi:hypothetical protein